MPLVGYVADEAHRFVTSDAAHGEQSFMDACRSFGAFCVLATQSPSSIRHALGADGTSLAAVEMMLANTATKLFFRSTDEAAQNYIAALCPRMPVRPAWLTCVRSRRCGPASATRCLRTGGWSGGGLGHLPG